MQPALLKPLEQSLALVLKDAGYKKKARYWWLGKKETILMVNLQLSQWGGDRFYINLGVYLRRFGDLLAPKEYECHVGLRLNPQGHGKPSGEFVFTDTSVAAVGRECELIGQLLRDNGLPWLVALSTESEIRRLFRPDPPLITGWLNDRVLEWLRSEA